jgi:hypothetical protein
VGVSERCAAPAEPRDASERFHVWALRFLTQAAYVKSLNTGVDDAFGCSVALSDGAVLAVGATLEDSNTKGVGGSQTDNSASDSGAVYVY